MSRRLALAAALLLAPALAAAAEVKAPTITVNGQVDSYYTLNLSHAQDYTVPTNGLSGDTGFNLNAAKLSTSAALAPVTVRLDLAYAKEAQFTTNLLVEQAFVSLKLGQVTFDAGRFSTPCGFEVLSAKDNWLYSHGLLFNFAMPLAHEGVRASLAVTPELVLTGYVANGGDLWSNDTGSTQSPYKTLILNGLWTRDATTLNGTLFFTKNPATAQDGLLLDVSFTQGLGKLALNLSGDYGSFSSNAPFASYSWFALAASARLELSEALRVSGRLEYLDDADGVRVVDATGTPLVVAAGATSASYLSLTAGAAYRVGQNADLKAELRLDKASEDVYRSAKDTAVTVTLAAIAWF